MKLPSRGPGARESCQVSVYLHLSLWPQDSTLVLHSRSARYNRSDLNLAVTLQGRQLAVIGGRLLLRRTVHFESPKLSQIPKRE